MKYFLTFFRNIRPYRNQGLASKLIQSIISSAEASHFPTPPSSIKIKQPATEEPADKKKKLSPAALAAAEKEREAKEKLEASLLRKPRVDSIYLHVQEGNEDGMKFWLRNGFEVKVSLHFIEKST